MEINEEILLQSYRKIQSSGSTIPFLVIKKDFYLTELLKQVIKNLDEFKTKNKIIDYFLRGGTNLSKCYLKTNRLSEDIDLTLVVKSRTKGKNTIKDIGNFFDCLEQENIIKKIKVDKSWGISRDYLNIEFLYNDISFMVDIKFIMIDNPLFKFLNLSLKEIFNISEKLGICYDKEKSKINSLSLEYTVAEKIIAFEKNYKFDTDIRCCRHPYDIYMIFKYNLLSNDKKTWNRIKNIYNEVCKTEVIRLKDCETKKYNTSFYETILMNKTIDKETRLISMLEHLIDNECYVKEKYQDIISFYLNLDI